MRVLYLRGREKRARVGEAAVTAHEDESALF